MKKFLRIGAISLALLMGFSSCSNDKGNTPNNDADNLSTYVGVNIAFPTADGMRGLPDDYNKKFGEWKGRDEIKKITIYLVNETQKKVDYASFNEGSFEAIDGNGLLKPTLAVKATAGNKVRAYAVINDVNNKTAALNSTGYAEFDQKFKELQVEVANSQDVAKYENSKDVVMMTNTAVAEIATVEDNVTKEQAIEGTKNRADIQVSRVVSRAIVTIGNNMEIKVKDLNGKDISTATVTDVKYAVGQSNKKFYNMQKTDFSTPDPVYTYVPTTDNWATTGNTYFDYSDLADAKAPKVITTVDETNVKNALNTEEFSKFVLPVTHATEANYKKGNMTYFEITCKFKADKVYSTASNAAAPEFAAGTEGQDVFLGMSDGKFYTTRDNAEANGQQATHYKKGVMKYVIWLNPNVGYDNTTQKITMSPTVRNQVYHAHISGFKEIGVPNNPLNPDDPDDPDNPDNPIDPSDDPETQKTYLSVSVKVLPWTIHSYTVDLSNRY